MARGQISLFDARASEKVESVSACAGECDAGDGRGDSPEHAVSVSQINHAVKRSLEAEFSPLWVRGEIANWRPHANGHRYFSLRDDSAQLRCVMWRSDVERLPIEPEEGMEVCARGQLTVYEARGTYQLIVHALQAEGEGLWRLAFQRLKEKLQREGLLDPARKRPLPTVPLCVGIVTSVSGAAVRDVVSVVLRRAPWTRLLVSDCRVQGDGAAADIVAALDRLVLDGRSEVIILTRGGGSIEDLWAFNEELVARAIAGCPIPTISAVGHEVDVTIADLAADRRAPTPSVAGEMAVEDSGVLLGGLQALAAGLVSGLRGRVAAGGVELRRTIEALIRQPREHFERRDGRLALLGGRLDALSPLGTLSRGFAVARAESGRVLRSISEFHPGRKFRLRVVDGEAECETLHVGVSDEPKTRDEDDEN